MLTTVGHGRLENIMAGPVHFFEILIVVTDRSDDSCCESAQMAAINRLPSELLHEIFEYLDLLNDDCLSLSSLAAMHPILPASLARGWGWRHLDTSIFDILRVNKQWRAVALSVIFKEQAAYWSCERSQIKLRRLRVLRIWLYGGNVS